MLGVEIPKPFPRMEFEQSMREYGNDKPDLRFGMQHVGPDHAGRGAPGGRRAMWQEFAARTTGQIVKA